jgi:hypothetical protein
MSLKYRAYMKQLIMVCLTTVFFFMVTDIEAAVDWPLRINTNGRYLEDQSGVPFLLTADAAWLAAVQISQADVITYLDDRAAKGFNALEIMAISSLIQSNAPGNYYGQAPFTNGVGDWSVRNEAYWANVDFVVAAAKALNMTVLMFPAYLGHYCGKEGWCSEMQAQTNAAISSYGTWIGNRYKDYGNIIWMVGGDTDPSYYPNVQERENALVSGIKAGDPDAFFSAEPDSEQISGIDSYATLVDINGIYTYGSPASKAKTAYGNARPFMFQEGFYENEHSSTLVNWDSQTLITILGGGLVGAVYGCCPLWSFGAGTDWCDSGSAPYNTWKAALATSGSVSQGNIGKLMRSRKWWGFVPDYTNVVVTSSKGTELNYHATAREGTGETIMVWCPNTAQVTVDLTKVSGSYANVWSWNPANNSSSLVGTYATTGTRSFSPSAATVLVLDDASKGLSAPGVTGTSDTFIVSASVSGSNGSVSPQTQNITSGQSASITITPNTGYSIGSITDNGQSVSIANPYVISNVTVAHVVVVSFVPLNTYTLTITKTGDGTGTITTSPAGTTFSAGTSVTLTATPDTYSTFAGWSGGCSGSQTTTCTAVMNNNVSVSAAFNLNTLTINSSAGIGGSISPSGSILVKALSSQSFTITPSIGYLISSVKIDGISISPIASYTFNNIKANHTITASYTQIFYMVSASVSGNHGSVSPRTQNVASGQPASITITPYPGYSIGSIKDNGQSVSIANPYVISNVTVAHIVVVSFVPLNTYTLTITKTGNGTGTIITSPAGTTFSPGTSVTLTATPDTYSTFAGWSGGCSGSQTSTCTVTMNSNVSVSGAFNLKTFTITSSAGTGGSISPSGSISVNAQSSQTFTITPSTGYNISSVKIDGISISPIASYTFNNITANHTITASFTQIVGGETVTYFGQQTSNSTDNIGDTGRVATIWGLNGNALFKCPGSGNQIIQELSLYCYQTHAVNIRIGVYSGGQLVAEGTSEVAVIANGGSPIWQGHMTQASIKAAGGSSPGILVGGQSYTFAFTCDYAGSALFARYMYDGSGPSRYNFSDYTNGMISTLPSGNTANGVYEIRCGVKPQ